MPNGFLRRGSWEKRKQTEREKTIHMCFFFDCMQSLIAPQPVRSASSFFSLEKSKFWNLIVNLLWAPGDSHSEYNIKGKCREISSQLGILKRDPWLSIKRLKRKTWRILSIALKIFHAIVVISFPTFICSTINFRSQKSSSWRLKRLYQWKSCRANKELVKNWRWFAEFINSSLLSGQVIIFQSEVKWKKVTKNRQTPINWITSLIVLLRKNWSKIEGNKIIAQLFQSFKLEPLKFGFNA